MSLIDNIADCDRQIESVRNALAAAGLEPEALPEQPDPRWCCGRGCHPCIFTVYFEAVEAWMTRQRQRVARAPS